MTKKGKSAATTAATTAAATTAAATTAAPVQADEPGQEIQTDGAKAAAATAAVAAAHVGSASAGEAPATTDAAAVAAETALAAGLADKDASARVQEIINRMAAMQMLRGDDPRSRKQPKGDMSDYKFWSTQPVPRTDEEISQDGPIEPNKAPEEIRQEPYPLPKDFEWVTMDLLDPAQLKQVYDLLTLNYVEDDDATLRFDYKAEFLQWAVMSPGWRKEWHVGVRVASTGKLVGFISGIPADLSVHKKSVSLVEINFLCVHKKLRSKRLAPVLIKEITRRVHLFGIFQAVYTAGVYLPKPVGTCRYYHRSLNPKKLVETGFSAIGRNMTMKQMILRYKLPEEPSLPGIRPMVEADVPRVTKLLKQYLGRSGLFPILSQEEVSHWLLPKENVVFSYVVCDPPNSQKVTDFVSFYSLPSSVIGNPKHSSIEAAYLFYYVPRDMGKDVQRTQALIKDALIFARKAGFDVFNCLNEFMDNQSFTEDLKFGKGDGDLHYYLYNYRCRDITAPPSEVMGLLLL